MPFDINADIVRSLRDWDRVEIAGRDTPCRYDEEYEDDSTVQGVSRTVVLARADLSGLAQGDTVDRVTTIDGRRLGPYTVEEIQFQLDATVAVRLRDPS